MQEQTTELEALRAEVTQLRTALSTQHSMMQAFIDGSTAVIYIKDYSGKYLLINRRYEELFHVHRDTIRGRTDFEIFSPQAAQCFRENDLRVFRERQPITFEENVPQDDGEHYYVSVKFPLFDADGQVYAMCGISTDITERRRIEEALLQSERRLQRVTDAVPGAVFQHLRLPDGEERFTFLSRGVKELCGVEAQELIEDMSKAWAMVLPEDVPALAASAMRSAALAEHWEQEFRIRHADGSIRWIRGVSQSEPPDENGVVEGVGVLIDVTQRRQHETELALVRTAVQQSHEAVVITDAVLHKPGPRILFVNPAFERMTGYSAQEVVGLTPRILQGPKTDPRVLARLRTDLTQGRSFVGETTNYRKDGSEYLVEWAVAPVRDAGGTITNWVSIQRDVTEERRLQAAMRAHEARSAHVNRLSTLGEMATALAHELNQPLTAISNFGRGCLRRMEQAVIPPDQLRSAIEQMVSQADRAGKIIRRIRSFARRPEPQNTTVDLHAVLQGALELCDAELRKAHVRVETDLRAASPRLLADAIQIEQVAVNLIRNAVEAMAGIDPSQRKLCVRTADQGALVVVSFSDTGPGLDDDARAHAFEAFYTTKPQGLGMGLAISRSLIEAHGGTLTAPPTDLQGATFKFTLPRQPTQTPCPKPTASDTSVKGNT